MLKKLMIAAAGAALLVGGCMPSDPIANNVPRPTRFREAEALYLAKNYDAAKGKFLAVASSEASPERPYAREASYYAARCDQNMGRYIEAVKVYNRLLDAPAYKSLEVRALVSRGDISMEIGANGVPDYAGAAHDYALARRLLGQQGQIGEIDHGMLTYNLGRAYYGLAVNAPNSEEREACYVDADKCFREYLDRYPNGQFREDARRRLSTTTGRAPVTNFYVQIAGGTSVRSQAESTVAQLQKLGAKAYIVSEQQGNVKIYRVRSGAFKTEQEAWAEADRLTKAGFNARKAP